MELNHQVTNKELFLKNLKIVMDERGLSQSDLARIIGSTRQHVTKILNSDSKGVNTTTIDEISLALGFEENDLLNKNFKSILNKNKK